MGGKGSASRRDAERPLRRGGAALATAFQALDDATEAPNPVGADDDRPVLKPARAGCPSPRNGGDAGPLGEGVAVWLRTYRGAIGKPRRYLDASVMESANDEVLRTQMSAISEDVAAGDPAPAGCACWETAMRSATPTPPVTRQSLAMLRTPDWLALDDEEVGLARGRVADAW